MKKRLKTIAFDSFLVGVILFLILLFHSAFIAGPQRAHEHQDRLYVEAFEAHEQLQNLVLIDRFSFDKVYYIVSDNENKTLYWFDTDLKETGEVPYQALDDAYAKAEEMGFSKKNIRYGVYKNKIVYRLSDMKRELFLSLEDLSVVFEFGGK